MSNKILIDYSVIKQGLDALKTLHDETMDYLTLNKLGGENNQCMVFARNTIDLLQNNLVQRTESECNSHPDAPHGFDRNASHNEGRYVCECEDWEPQQAGPVQPEYGSTDCATFAGLPMTDGDKRLAAMLTQAFGADHPAIHDLVALLFAARGKQQAELAVFDSKKAEKT